MLKLNEYKLEDLYGMSSGLSSSKNQAGHGYPFVTFKTVFDNYFLPDEISDLMDTSQEERESLCIKKDDILLTRTSETSDELAMSCVALKDYPNTTFSGFLKRLRPKTDGIAYGKYMAFYLRSPYFRNVIINNTTMTLRASFNEDIFSFIKVYLPSFKDQKKIGDFLFLLDSKITYNKQINDNLAKQAMILYEQMLGTNPLTKYRLCDIASITMGQSPVGSSYNEEGIGTVFYQGRTGFGFRFPTRRLYTTAPKKMASKNDVLLSVRAPVGDINMANESCCIGRGLSCLRSLHNTPSFLYYTMASIKPILDQFNGEGTVFGSVSQDALNNLSIQIPSTEQISSFETKVAPMDAMIMNNNEEILRLTALRDYLLPRLLNGQISI